MKIIKKFLLLFLIMMIGLFNINSSYAISNIDEIISNMTNKEKIAMMLMPAFRKEKNVDINYDNIKSIISSYEFAGVILFGENTKDIESTMRFVDLLQDSNKNHNSRLLIAIDQEGGYITRLGVGTAMSGNMALGASDDEESIYMAGSIIGRELKMLGINTNFAPVVDVNNNPANPVIGVRSFSDDASLVAKYANSFMKGLQSEGITTSLKHFPGHGDTINDTHTCLSIINKSYAELKKLELVPFQELINNGTDMIMSAHIQYPNIETNTYVSVSDNQQYTLPATLSKTILTDILRNDMGYKGIIVTDALDMDAIANNFELVDASVKAINAGADILLMPFIYDSQIDKYDDYINTLANKVGNEISEENVNASVKRILTLKSKKGLLNDYDNSKLEEDIVNAKKYVSSIENHKEEFEIAKKTITMIKNDNNILPLNGDEKTVILYEYASHIKSFDYAFSLLNKDGININKDNISYESIYDGNAIDIDKVKEKIGDAKTVIMVHSLYNSSDLVDPDLDRMNQIIEYVHEMGGKVIALSTQLPYDVVKFNNADAIVLTYLANGIKYNIEEYDSELLTYGPNVLAGVYMLYSNKDDMKGKLPVNIYKLDDNNKFINEVLYSRGFGLEYFKEETEEVAPVIEENENVPDTSDNILDSLVLFIISSLSLVGLFIFKEKF